MVTIAFLNMGFMAVNERTGFFQSQLTATPLPAQPAFKEYVHPSNTFSIQIPTDWIVSESDETAGYAMFTAPDSTAIVEIFAENTIETLTAEQFSKAIDAAEFNIFSKAKNFKETKREIQSNKGYAIISKTFDINKVPFQCSTIYEIKEKGLYVESYYSAVSAVAKTGPIFTTMDNSFKSNPSYLEDIAPFTSGLSSFADQDEFYRLLVPALWTYEDKKKDGTVITLASPDDNAYVMLVKENQGKTVTRAMADKRTLDFLKALFSDVRIEKTEVLANGSIMMLWAPKSGGLQAASIYKWNGKFWFILTWMVNSGFEKTYSATFNKSMESLSIPE